MKSPSDQELIGKYLEGDEKALEILIQRYLKPVYNFAYRYAGNIQEAEDIAQDAFVKIWKNLKKFDGRKNFRAWIFSIAKNTALDFLKKKKAAQFSDLGDETAENFIDPSPLPEEISEKKNMNRVFTRAIGKLFPGYRKVLLFRCEENLTFREIAESLGEPLNTVKSRYRRALIMLKKFIPES